jgi:hypothetical protein
MTVSEEDHRRKILHCNVTRQPNAFWIVLQLREDWGFERPHRFLIFDRDSKFSADVLTTVEDHGTQPVRTCGAQIFRRTSELIENAGQSGSSTNGRNSAVTSRSTR